MWFKLSTISAQQDHLESEQCAPPVALVCKGGGDQREFALDELFERDQIRGLPQQIGRFVDLNGALYFLPSAHAQSTGESPLQYRHIRDGEQSVVDDEGVEVWSGHPDRA